MSFDNSEQLCNTLEENQVFLRHNQPHASEKNINYNILYELKQTKKNNISDNVTKNIRRCTIFRNSRLKQRRLVSKNGSCNIANINVKKRGLGYLSDLFTTLVDITWPINLVIFTFSFFVTWIFYACVWWIISVCHGDTQKLNNTKTQPCVTYVYSFTSAFIFSVESQLAIGYGHRYLTDQCPVAIIALCLQSITGIIIQSFMVGVVFAKLTQPRRRAGTLIFSKKAVICQRDGVYCLMFRIGDMRKSHLIGATVRAHLLKKKVTKEGEIIPLFMNDVNLGFNNGEDRLFLLIPVTVCHIIDEKSPFWNMSGDDLIKENFELIIILEGTIESTGCTMQARTSYLPSEIYWGYNLQRLITYEKQDGEYHIDFSHFNEIYSVNIPMCSAKEYSENNSLDENESINKFISHSINIQTD